MRSILAAFSILAASGAQATDIDLIGLFPGKAVLVIDGGAPKTLSVGAPAYAGIRLISVNDAAATIEENGKREILTLGGYVNRSASSGPASITLQPDSKGHYLVQGQINGSFVRMLVDTGASLVSLPATDARRLGIDYKKGQLGLVNTANGTSQVYRVMLDSVKIGDIQLSQVEAVVHETGLPIALLGMSFLNRMEMRRDGEEMLLTKRF